LKKIGRGKKKIAKRVDEAEKLGYNEYNYFATKIERGFYALY